MVKRGKKSSYVDDLHRRLRDPSYAAEYLNGVLAETSEGEDAAFLLALRDVAEAQQMSKVAVAAGVNRENLYRMLSGRGNPRLSSLLAVMKALGLHLSVQHEFVTKTEPPVAEQTCTEKIVRRSHPVPAIHDRM
jgi:probable addiction module antidote protein